MLEPMTSMGVVKSWNGSKGFGFIQSEYAQGDVFFSKNELPLDAREVQGSFLQGRTVAYELAESPDARLKAAAVHVLHVEGAPIFGVVKSFSEKNGYGFLSSSALAEDVHFSTPELPPLAPGVSIVGAHMLFSVTARPDGKLTARELKFQSGKDATRLRAGAALSLGQPSQLGMPQQDNGQLAQIANILLAKGGVSQGSPLAQLLHTALSTLQMEQGLVHGPQPKPRHQRGGEMTGRIKSFSEKTGYGFIMADGVQGDIKFTAADVSDPSALQAGASVRFTVATSPHGRLQARGLHPVGGQKRPAPSSVDPSRTGVVGATVTSASGPILPGGAYTQKQPRLAPGGGAGRGGGGGGGSGGGTGQFSSGTVKSYFPEKRFGFITSPELDGDAYFMTRDLTSQADAASLEPGVRVSYEIAYAPDGKLRATQVSALP